MTRADDQQERLEHYWIVGFVDWEGCFSISCNRNSTTKLGYQIFPEFVVTQGEGSYSVLESIQKYFGCGNIFINRRYDNHREPIYRYCVRSFDDLEKIIIPFFRTFPLRTAKQNDFTIFCQVVELVRKRKHLEKDGLEEILLLKSQMNRKKKVTLESSETRRQTFHNVWSWR